MTPFDVARASTCTRTLQDGSPAHVGCILRVTSSARGELARSHGANGGDCNGAPGACGCVHAEMNALAKLPAVTRERGEALWLLAEVTLSPCVPCAEALLMRAKELQASLVVYYAREYRLPTGLEILRQGGAVAWPFSCRP